MHCIMWRPINRIIICRTPQDNQVKLVFNWVAYHSDKYLRVPENAMTGIFSILVRSPPHLRKWRQPSQM